jgi:putative acetyltransferase
MTHPFEPGDPSAPDVAALLESSEAHSRSLYPPVGVHLLDVSALTGPAVIFRVARSAAGTVEGCGAIVLEPDGSAELKSMFVAPSARRRGLGASILEHLERQARDARATVMRLETGPLQKSALALYRRSGYRVRGPFGSYREDQYSIFMEKDLT